MCRVLLGLNIFPASKDCSEDLSILAIVGKPLQLFVALSVIDQIGSPLGSDILIVDNFKGAKMLSDRMGQYGKKYRKVEFVTSFDEAYSFLTKEKNKYQKLLIDSDVGTRKCFQLFAAKRANKNIDVCVYEEGWGSYRSDLYKNRRVKQFLFQKLGVGHAFGGCFLTDLIYLYDVDRYRKSLPLLAYKAIQIKQPLHDYLRDNYSFLSYIFNLNKIKNTLDIDGRDVHLVLTDTHNREHFSYSLKNFSGVKLWKVHPHMKNKLPNVRDFFIIDNAIPSEILLIYLALSAKKVFVYNFKTSTEEYIKDSKITFVRLN